LKQSKVTIFKPNKDKVELRLTPAEVAKTQDREKERKNLLAEKGLEYLKTIGIFWKEN
jgi:hypothetical protein